jgi:hypothetical protein
MLIPKKTEDGVQNEEGKPAEEGKESKPTGQSEEGNVVDLDVTKRYRSRRNPGKEVSGADLWSGYTRGMQVDKLQSQVHKLLGDDQLKTKEIADLRAERDSLIRKAEFAENIREYDDARGQKGTEFGEDEDSLFGEPPAPPRRREPQPPTAEENRAYMKQLFQQFAQGLEDKAAENEQQQEKERLVRSAQEATDTLRKQRLALAQVRLPDATEAEREDLVNRTGDFVSELLKTAEKYTAGNVQEGNEHLFDGEDVLNAYLDKEVELRMRQAKLDLQREREAELEGISLGRLPGDEEEEENESAYDWHEGEKKRERRLAKAKEMTDKQTLLKRSGAL